MNVCPIFINFILLGDESEPWNWEVLRGVLSGGLCKEECEIKLPFQDEGTFKNVLHVDLFINFTNHSE